MSKKQSAYGLGLRIGLFLGLLLFLAVKDGFAQEFLLFGKVSDASSGYALIGASVKLEGSQTATQTDDKGTYSLRIPAGDQRLVFSYIGYVADTLSVRLSSDLELLVALKPEPEKLDAAEITTDGERDSNLGRMPSVQGTAIYKGMKSEVLKPSEMNVNISTNNSRQVYAKVPGLNIWENDGAGIQLGIGARGLSPNRTSHFNVRQNLYDISADALGYPESYYTPPLEAVERIEIIRGAAALQYGTQFGGLLNFKMKEGGSAQPKVQIRQSVGTYGLQDTISDPIAFYNTFVSVGGKKNNTSYYGFYQYKGGSGYRPNSDFDVQTAYARVSHNFGEKLTIGAEFTHMDYLAQQAGGLTDKVFAENPRLSFRDRNWFKVNWNLAALDLSYRISPFTEITSKTFGLLASREALGFLGETQRPDPLAERDLISGQFKNIGNETRIIHKIIKEDRFWVFAGGLRLYRGQNETQQGSALAGPDAQFEFIEREDLPLSSYTFPNYNVALYGQAIIPISPKLSFTPGIRYEYISTRSDGFFDNILLDGAGNLIESERIQDAKNRTRNFVLVGGGLSYQASDQSEIYANWVQNYRAINFSDIQIRNTSLVIDSLITDERGYNADIGWRGKTRVFQFDASVFALIYQDRIGEVNRTFDLLGVRRFRTNISDARTIGVEAYVEANITEAFLSEKSEWLWKVFANASAIDAVYSDEEDTFFFGKRVELVPAYTVIGGLSTTYKAWSARLQYSRTGQQFSDASNVGANPDFPATANAIDGIIPEYQVMDLTLGWKKTRWSAQFSINNLLNEQYFTRRASGYPGPGIIPSDGRSFFLTLGWSL